MDQAGHVLQLIRKMVDDVVERDDPCETTERTDYRQAAYADALHDLQRRADGLGCCHGDGLLCHDVSDAQCRRIGAPGHHRNHDISIGEHTDGAFSLGSKIGFHDHEIADVLLAHEPGSSRELVEALDRDDTVPTNASDIHESDLNA